MIGEMVEEHCRHRGRHTAALAEPQGREENRQIIKVLEGRRAGGEVQLKYCQQRHANERRRAGRR
jgi:hypothetical protein